MIEAMAGICLQDPAFRASLPVGYATHGISPETLAATFGDLADRFARSAPVATVVDSFAEEFVSGRRALMPDQRGQILAVDTVDLDSRVGLRPGLIYRSQQSEAGVTLHCHTTEITFPRHAAASLDHVLRASSFVVRDLPGDLDEPGKLVLIRRLIGEGLVRRLS